MKSQNKIKKNSLKFKLIFIFTVLVMAALVILWISQLLITDNAYNSIRGGSVKNDAELICENINSDKLQPLITRIAGTGGVSIVVIDPNGNVKYSAHSAYSPLEDLSASGLKVYYESAAQNEGEYLQSARSVTDTSYDKDNYVGDVPENLSSSKEKYIAYSKLVADESGNDYAVVVAIVYSAKEDSPMLLASLISTTVVSVLFLVIGIVTMFFAAKKVVEPIEQLIAPAKSLAEGDTRVKFDAKGFSEVEELSDVLNKTAGELGKLDTLRKELIANVSHDLRTPLTLIRGYSEMMRDIPSERNDENFQVVIDESERLTNLVNDMLNLSRIQNADNELKMVNFDIVQATSEVTHRVAKMLTAEQYVLELKSTLKSAVVLGDKDRLMQVVYNLLSNAINYIGDDKKILVNIRRNGNNVRIEVIDHGIGIDVAHAEHIWDRYYKSDRSHKRAVIGTGLGLSIVKSVMEGHPGGLYGVNTSLGYGSTFYVELPCKEFIANI